MTTPRWRKVARGFYSLDGTPYAVQQDGYESRQHVGAEGDYEGFIGGEWAAMRGDDNLAWFGTMREARAYVERPLA